MYVGVCSLMTLNVFVSPAMISPQCRLSEKWLDEFASNTCNPHMWIVSIAQGIHICPLIYPTNSLQL